jgi:hypothetical protein
MVDIMNYDNFKQTTTHDPKNQIHIIIIEAKLSK